MAAKSFCGHDGKIMFLKAIRDGEYDLSKQEWGEEDNIIKNVISYLNGEYGFKSDDDEYAYRKGLVKQLKSFHPQPHTASIKDATKFGNLEYERGVKDGIQSEKSRQWKPNKEQMEALKASYSVLKTHDTWGEDEHLPLLLHLYNDLKKL